LPAGPALGADGMLGVHVTGSFARLRAGLTAATLIAGFGGLIAVAAPASADPTTRYVATDGDDGNGDNVINDCTVAAKPCKTIQHAVDEAAAGDTVRVGPGEFQESVRIRKSLTVQGAGATGAGKTVVDGNHDGGASITVDGVEVEGTVAVTVEDVAVDGNPDADGIEVEGNATLELVDSSASNNNGIGVVTDGKAATITNSTLSHDGFAGAVVSAGTLHVTGSLLSQNASPTHEGGAFGNGIAVLGGSATVDASTVSDNESVGIYVFAAGLRDVARVAPPTFEPNVTAAITGTTVSGNGETGVAVGPGAAATIDKSTLSGNAGAGIYAQMSSVIVSNSTISDAHPLADSTGIFAQGGIVYLSSAPGPTNRAGTRSALRFSAGNESPLHTAGIRHPAVARADVTAGVQVVGTIVAEQSGKLADCAGDVVDNGYNLSSDADNSCKFSAAKHDQFKTDPRLGPLADNGGPTKTQILKKLSPAIDAIPGGKANCSADATDQRGVARPQPVGGKCDVGAVEVAAKPLAIHPDSLPKGTVGDAYHAKVTATGGQYPIYTFSLAAGSLPDGLSIDEHGSITGTPTKAGTFHFTVSVNDPVLKAYTIVIADAAGTNDNGDEPIAATGAPVLSMSAIGAATVLAGFLLMVGAGAVGRRPGRHRSRG
jgi:hypothetical protein